MRLWRLIPVQAGWGGGQRRRVCQREGQSFEGHGTWRGLKASYKRVFRHIFLPCGTSTKKHALSCASSTRVTALICKPVSGQSKPMGDCKHTAQGERLRVLLGRMGIYRKGWRRRFMRLEPICQAVSRGFPLPWSFPSRLYLRHH